MRRMAVAALVCGAPAQAWAETRYVRAMKVNCRAQATTDPPVMAQFIRNASVSVVYTGDGWAQIDVTSLCWIRSRLLTERPIAAERERPWRASPRSASRNDGLRRPDRARSAR